MVYCGDAHNVHKCKHLYINYLGGGDPLCLRNKVKV